MELASEKNLTHLMSAVFQGKAINSPAIFNSKRGPTFATNFSEAVGTALFLSRLGNHGAHSFWGTPAIPKLN